MTIEEIKRKKQQYGYTNAQMAELSGVPLPTVQKVLSGETKSPRYGTVQALSSIFSKEDPEEPSARYPRQGSYTLEDYLALPDEQRVELIDGIFYDMSTPTTPHQMIGGAIHARLLSFILEKKESCLPFIAPTDVQLDCDNRTIVQPDVMIVCDRSKITEKRIFGAPDFIVEVLSPSTKAKDLFIKTAKYRHAGVREYWMADIKQEAITKFLFSAPDEEYPEGDTTILTYKFSEPVPVTVLNEEICIDFAEIAETYSFLNI